MERTVLVVRIWLLFACAALSACILPNFEAMILVSAAFAAGAACCCPRGSGCTCCNSGTEPATVQLVVSGTVNGSCSTCSGINGTFVAGEAGGNACGYFFTYTPGAVCGLYVLVSFAYSALAPDTGKMGWQIGNAKGLVPETCPRDCMTISESPFAVSNTGGEIPCNFSATSVSVSAL